MLSLKLSEHQVGSKEGKRERERERERERSLKQMPYNYTDTNNRTTYSHQEQISNISHGTAVR
jgi:hypothetical protein